MIKMVKAINLKRGMKVSTDGLVITDLADLRDRIGKIYVEGVCHGTFKVAHFNPSDELPIYYSDENGGED